MFSNYYHYSWISKIRTVFRKVGILKLVKPFFVRRQKSYEEAFHFALKGAVSAGDTVWDIGANVGLYTSQFLDWVGVSGEVVAFEPLPTAFQALVNTTMVHAYKNRAILECVALSDYSGEATFFDGDKDREGISKTAHLADFSETKSGITVKVSTADLIVNEHGLSIPNVVKIDVEGFEEDVLRGGEKTFTNIACQHLLIEVHFARIDERNVGNSVSRIVTMLKKWKYKIQWVDASHLHASR
ncbi:MAG: hypothetical protein JWQ63_2175 [Mucilaginibacter sp.]|nr:hypothetical protein [Mucilaginibacter sp.]